jgi:hypothetical protein
MTTSLFHSPERRSVPLASMALKVGFWTNLQTPRAANATPRNITNLCTNSIDHQQLLYRKRPNICISSTPIHPPQIPRRSTPSSRPIQITSFLVPQSPFRHQVETISKSLRHAEDMKSAARLTRKTQ